MSNEERLKLIKERIKYGDPDFVNISKDERDWLIEQAEKVEKLLHVLQYEKENRLIDKAEIEQLKKQLKESPMEYDFNWAKDI